MGCFHAAVAPFISEDHRSLCSSPAAYFITFPTSDLCQGSGSAPLDHEVMQARLDALEKAVLGTMSAAIAKNAALEAALVESSARRQQQQT